MSYWTDWEFSERELMECANATILRDRPDLQYKFDASAPPLFPAQGTEAQRAATTGAVEDDGPSPKGCAQNKVGG